MSWPFAGASRRSRRGSDISDPFLERGSGGGGGGQRGANFVPVYTSSLDEVSPLLSRDGNLMRPQGITVDDDVRGGAPNETIDDWEADKLEKQKNNLSMLEAEVDELRQELKQREEKGFDVSKLQADLQLMADEVEKERKYLRSQSKAANSCGSKLKASAYSNRNMAYYTLLLAANVLLVWWVWSAYHGHSSSSDLSPTAAPTSASDMSKTDSSEYSPTPAPTIYAPTSGPTDEPTFAPTLEPSYAPTPKPTHKKKTSSPTSPTAAPTALVDGMTPAEIADADPMAGVQGITDDYIHDDASVPDDAPSANTGVASASADDDLGAAEVADADPLNQDGVPETTDDTAEAAAPYDPMPSSSKSDDGSQTQTQTQTQTESESDSKSGVGLIGGSDGKDGDSGTVGEEDEEGQEEVDKQEAEEVEEAADVEDAEEDAEEEEEEEENVVSNWANAQHATNNGDGDSTEEAEVVSGEEEEEAEEALYDDMEGNEVEEPSSWADVQRSQNSDAR